MVIICTILLDVTTQLNIWSIIGVSGMRGQDIATKVLPGLGYFIAFLVALGGLVFNIGNVGGAATGLNVMFGLPVKAGTIIGGAIGILIFLSKDAKSGMDKMTKYLGSIMILCGTLCGIQIKAPVGEAVTSVFKFSEAPGLVFPMITLLGGSCGGYILSPAPPSLDAGFSGLRSSGSAQIRSYGNYCVRHHENLIIPCCSGRCYGYAASCGSDAWVASPPRGSIPGRRRRDRL